MPTTDTERLKEIFPDLLGGPETVITPMAQAGSPRRYYRVDKPLAAPIVATVGDDLQENATFISIARDLRDSGVNVPRIIAEAPDKSAYLQSWLGSRSLYDILLPSISSGDFSGEAEHMVRKVMTDLARIHWKARVKPEHCHPVQWMGNMDILWDLNYFKYCFLKPSGVTFDEAALEKDFSTVTRHIEDAIERQGREVFMYRDFQSRNVMVSPEGEPGYIDFQGGRIGLALYDVVSFLWQVRARFPSGFRDRMIDAYVAASSDYIGGDEARGLLDEIPVVILFRTLQVLGAYGFRGNFEKKPQFMQSIPGALSNLRPILDDLSQEMPELSRVLRELISRQEEVKPKQMPDGLTVTVTSFSYRKGYPTDTSGNGGGFVFDCRAVHNPGRYDQYKPLTGMDAPVKEFLEKDGEIFPFLDNAKDLIGAAVDKYLSRGFSSLCVSFGCTGGRHRSVYSAQSVAEWLAARGDLNVHLIHREQGVDKWL